jgi:hypothetical protein
MKLLPPMLRALPATAPRRYIERRRGTLFDLVMFRVC